MQKLTRRRGGAAAKPEWTSDLIIRHAAREDEARVKSGPSVKDHMTNMARDVLEPPMAKLGFPDEAVKLARQLKLPASKLKLARGRKVAEET